MVCRIKNRHTFKSLPILNSAYFTECRFVIRHITQTDTETETEANFTHDCNKENSLVRGTRILIDFNAFRECTQFIDMKKFTCHLFTFTTHAKMSIQILPFLTDPNKTIYIQFKDLTLVI